MRKMAEGILCVFLFFFIFCNFSNDVVLGNGYPIAVSFRYPIGDGTKQTFEQYGFGYTFGKCVGDPWNGRHLGLDASAPSGRKLYAIAEGKVVLSNNQSISGYGNCAGAGYVVVIEHTLNDGNRICSLYGHVRSGTYNEIDESGLVPVGTVVRKGQYIATIADYWWDVNGNGVCGDSGDQNWDHLHFGIRKGNFNETELYRYYKGYSKYQRDQQGNLLWFEDTEINGEVCFETNLGGNWTDPVAFIESHLYSTRFMDFEDGTDDAIIRSKIPGMTFTSTEGYDWIYSDIRTGKYSYPFYWINGNFCAWLGPYQGVGRIDFTGATAKTISLSYSGFYTVYLEAYDSLGNLIDSVSGPPNTGTGKMNRLSVSGQNIAYVLIHDLGNYWIIDDLEVGDLLAETRVNLPANFTVKNEFLETINQNESIWKTFFNEIYQRMKVILGWDGSELSIRVYRPDGSVYSGSQSNTPPIEIDIPNAEPGEWQFEVTAIDIPYENYPFALVIGVMPTVKISGGAYFYHNNYRASFQMDVNNLTGVPTGYLKYYYTKTRMNMVSSAITVLSVSGNTANIFGNCTINGVSGCTFDAQVTDGAPDQFGITIRKSDGSVYYSVGPQNISSGDLVIQ